jgi:hypothetical protein
MQPTLQQPTAEELQREIRVVAEGAQSEFGRKFDEAIGRLQQKLEATITKSTDSTVIVKTAGALEQVRALRSWPADRTRELQLQLGMLKEKR